MAWLNQHRLDLWLKTFTGTAVSYTGPGDVVTGAYAWWGLRAYSAATAGGNALDVKRASDNTTQTFKTLANGNLDVAGITTFLAATTGTVTKLYDQTGNGHDATFSDAPAITLSGLGSFPVVTFNGSSNTSDSVTITISPASTWVAVAERTGNFSAFNTILAITNTDSELDFSDANNAVATFLGTLTTVSGATDNAWHAIQAIFDTIAGGGNSLNVDSLAQGTSSGAGSVAWAGVDFRIGAFSGSSQFLTGNLVESGIWSATKFNNTQIAAMNSNQHTYWGL